jgi:alkylation response protein AidB-like acyl-CoA dehydrogenase
MGRRLTWEEAMAIRARGDAARAFLPTLMNKLYTTELSKQLAELGHDLLESDVSLAAPDLQAHELRQPQSASRGDGNGWTLAYLSSHASAIAAGSSNIQRNIIGERALGLPRDLRRTR